MDLSQRLSLSYYKNIATLNKDHHVYLVQHQSSNKIFVKKILFLYDLSVFINLKNNPIMGIPKIIELFETDNSLIIIEEYINGETLDNKINNNSLTHKDIISYTKELCRTLDQLHKLDPPLIHRDIKPSNIIITISGNAVLLDFNAAKNYDESKSSDTVLIGTKGYAAPEQYGFGSSSPKTDIYALGILIKEMTASINDTNIILKNIISKSTQLDPANRYHSVSQIYDLISKKKFSYDKKLKKLIPPGFRRKNLFHMILGILGYLLIILLSFSLKIESLSGFPLFIERLLFLSFAFSIISVFFNFLNIQDLLPLCKNTKRLLRYLGIFLLISTLFSAYIILFALTEFIFLII